VIEINLKTASLGDYSICFPKISNSRKSVKFSGYGNIPGDANAIFGTKPINYSKNN